MAWNTPRMDGEKLTAAEYNEVVGQLAAREYYHGFENRTDSIIEWTDTSPTPRTFIIRPKAASYNIYYQGTVRNITTEKYISLGASPGLWYAAFDSSGSLQLSASMPSLFTTNIIALIYWNGTTGFLREERHGAHRNLEWHEWAHNTIGMRYGSGLTFTFTTATPVSQFEITSGTLYDEDLQHTIPASTSYFTANKGRVFYQNGANTYTFQDAVSPSPFAWNAATSKVQYSTGTALADVKSTAGGRYVNVWVYSTPDINQKCTGNPSAESGYPVSFFVETLTGAVLADGGYATPAAARAASVQDLTGLGVSPEIKLTYRLVVFWNGTVEAITTADDFRRQSYLSGGAAAGTSAASVTFSPVGYISSTNVQSALAEVDSEKMALPANTTVIAKDGGNYTTIQAALTAHPTANFTFLVYPGTYTNDTINFTANNQIILGMSEMYSTIVTSATGGIVNTGAFTGCEIYRINLYITAATASTDWAITIGAGGNLLFHFSLVDVTNASCTDVAQPCCINITGGSGSCSVNNSQMTYTNAIGTAGGAGIKAAVLIGTGTSVSFSRSNIAVYTEGAAADVTPVYSSSAGTANFRRNNIYVEDAGTTSSALVHGLAHITSGAGTISAFNNECGFYGATDASSVYGVHITGTTRLNSSYNRYIVRNSGSGTYATAYKADDTSYLNSNFDEIECINVPSIAATATAHIIASTRNDDTTDLALFSSNKLKVGYVGRTTGQIQLSGSNSGKITITPKAIAGTHTITLPYQGGTANWSLIDDGSGNWTWESPRMALGATPVFHSTSHSTGGTDEILPASIGAMAVGATPVYHSTSHIAGGADIIPQLDLADGKSVKVFKALGTDLTTSGLTVTLTAHENVAFGDLCFINASGEAAKTDADAAATMPAVVMATATINADAAGLFLLTGIARKDAWEWTPGVPLFVDGATPGNWTITAPTGTTDCVQIAGRALTADIVLFKPDNTWIEIT